MMVTSEHIIPAYMYLQAMQDIDNGLLFFDSSEQLVWHNDQAKKLLSLYFGILPEQMPLQMFLAAFPQGANINGGHQFETPDGKTAVFHLNVLPQGDVVVILRDITSDIVYQNRIAQQQKFESLGQLAGGIAHDFNNILSIVEGFARSIKRKTEFDDSVQEDIEKIFKATKRGADLTRKLLAFGRQKLHLESVYDLSQVVQDHEVLLKPLVGDAINLQIKVSPESLFIKSAPDLVTQVLLNICSNARDAMPEGGDLYISVSRSEHNNKMACLEIQDTGQGMSDEVASHVYDPFYTTKDQGKGSGLGMSAVYGLITQVKGCIDFETQPGKGTIFRVYLPLTDDIPETLEHQAKIQPGSLKGRTIVLAEDEDDLRDVMGAMLKDLGMNVMVAQNADFALVEQENYEGRIDFLLTDVVMPGMNGVKLAELFQSLRPESCTVFMSGYPAGFQATQDIIIPENACLMAKPIDPELLPKTLSEQLEKRFAA